MFETIILPAILLGFSATSVPGPLQAYLLNITLNYGWRKGLLVIISPLIVDGPIIFVTVFVLQQIPDWAIQGIRVSGGLLLLWIAWGAWQQLQAGASFSQDENAPDTSDKSNMSAWQVLTTGLAMNALSPGPYLFWSTVTGPLLIEALNISLWGGVGMLLGFYGAFLGSMAVLVLIFNQLGQINANITRYILVITIGLLVWFATQLIMAQALNLLLIQRVLTVLIVLSVAGYLARAWWHDRTRQIASEI
ncbi:MAG: LysE family translocator [Anaerolineae bacterium]